MYTPVVSSRQPLPGEYALLAMLRLQPMHGYEMSRFLAREGLAEVCPIEHNLLYAYLRNLEDRGLVTWAETRVGAHPPRKTYELTTAGSAAIESWLGEPVLRMRQ